jgi:hypothetical protein
MVGSYDFFMIAVQITVQRREDDWYIRSCTADFGHGLVRRLAAPMRRFQSQHAAVNFMKRLVLREARILGRQETGSDIVCQVRQ